jgi:hypothetical protein
MKMATMAKSGQCYPKIGCQKRGFVLPNYCLYPPGLWQCKGYVCLPGKNPPLCPCGWPVNILTGTLDSRWSRAYGIRRTQRGTLS